MSKTKQPGRIQRINPFAVIQTDTGYLTGEDWNEMASRLERLEAWVENHKEEAARRRELERELEPL